MLSVILPVYNEEDTIEHSAKRLEEVLNALDNEYEILFIDDGSKDKTWDNILKFSSTNKNIKGLSLSRNFGKERAIHAGLHKAVGDAVIIMDGDLQHPPEVIPKMVGLWKETGCDVVNGIKKGRGNEDFIFSFLVNGFYKIYRFATGMQLQGASDFKLLNRRVVDVYKLLNERDLFFRGLIPWLGFSQKNIEFEIAKREQGKTKWTGLSRYFLAVNAISSFSSLPLQLVTLMGIIFMFFAFFLFIQTMFVWLSGNAVAGFTTVILILLFIGSVLMISLGIIGQYLAKIYSEVKRRPIYLLKDTSGF